MPSCSLGFKLALGWREQQERGQLPPLAGDLYDLLRQRGFEYFEFSTGACQDEGELLLLRRESAACRDAGLAVSLHPYLEAPQNPGTFGRAPESTAAIKSILAAGSLTADIAGRPVRLVLHPAAASYDPHAIDLGSLRRVLLARSKLFFAAMEGRLRAHPQVQTVVEHQVPPVPQENVIRIGDTYAELLEVVASTRLGLCWDTGHYLLSVARRGQSADPPEEFLRRVEAVHLHDVVEGSDHQVISRDSARLRDYMRLLWGRDFAGAVTLEYSPEALRAAGSFEGVIEVSLEALASWAG